MKGCVQCNVKRKAVTPFTDETVSAFVILIMHWHITLHPTFNAGIFSNIKWGISE